MNLIREYLETANILAQMEEEDFENEDLVLVFNQSAARIRFVAQEIEYEHPELKEQFKQLLFIDSITIRIWVAHHILEVMNYDNETRAAALKEIALAKRLSEPSYALGNKIWLEKWLQKYPDDADLLL
ncbi:MAG: hypothetical protein IJC90_00755 [Clostridia bacterium]|nr:hypothetical protein [Oscillospiraceae bacterium]MBQ4102969.1 hypothetical protein [Clostridia bacterium]